MRPKTKPPDEAAPLALKEHENASAAFEVAADAVAAALLGASPQSAELVVKRKHEAHERLNAARRVYWALLDRPIK